MTTMTAWLVALALAAIVVARTYAALGRHDRRQRRILRDRYRGGLR